MYLYLSTALFPWRNEGNVVLCDSLESAFRSKHVNVQPTNERWKRRAFRRKKWWPQQDRLNVYHTPVLCVRYESSSPAIPKPRMVKNSWPQCYLHTTSGQTTPSHVSLLALKQTVSSFLAQRKILATISTCPFYRVFAPNSTQTSCADTSAFRIQRHIGGEKEINEPLFHLRPL